MNIEKLRQGYIKQGYTRANSIAKVCQDLILYAISKSPYFSNVTIKGGVVIHSLSSDMRRATRDIDLDFIKYSLENNSIYNFVEKLNYNKFGISFKINGEIEELHHQDYKGKRVNVIIQDSFDNKLETKLDIGVHKNFNLEQDEYCFDLKEIDETATLFINSIEQIFVEKLKSLLRFGALSTRYKDIFDFYYFINNTNIDKQRFNKYLEEIVYKDPSINVSNITEIISKLENLFDSKVFVNHLKNAKNNWINEPIEEVLNCIVIFIKNFESINI